MEIILYAIGGLFIGAIGAILVSNFVRKKAQQSKIDEINQKADLIIKEARITSKRMIDEAETKSEKILDKAESKNERIKQNKIQEAKEKFAKLKSDYEERKAQHRIEMKETRNAGCPEGEDISTTA